jgi:hypothetical protein
LASNSVFNLPPIAAAESFLGFVIDGGQHRIYYSGLKAALGGVTPHTSASAANNNLMAKPVDVTMSHVGWDDLHKESLCKSIRHRLGGMLTYDLVKLLIDRIKNIPADLQSQAHAFFWIELAISIECMRQGKSDDAFTVEYHHQPRRKHALLGTIDHDTLARVLLHPRTQIGYKALAATLLDSYLKRSWPDKSPNERLTKLAEMLLQYDIKVWPQSKPVVSRDYSDRWWRINADGPERTLQETLQWLSDEMSLSTINFPGILELNFYSVGATSRAWQVMENYLTVNQRFNCPPFNATWFRALWAIIVATYCEQVRTKRPMFHPYIHWAVWRDLMPNLDEMCYELVQFGVLHHNRRAENRSIRETLFDRFVVCSTDFLAGVRQWEQLLEAHNPAANEPQEDDVMPDDPPQEQELMPALDQPQDDELMPVHDHPQDDDELMPVMPAMPAMPAVPPRPVRRRRRGMNALLHDNFVYPIYNFTI